jgi:hypothetical protein
MARARRAPIGVGVTLCCQDVGDPVHGCEEPDGITGGGFGHDGFQPIFGVEAEHILGAAAPLGSFRSQCRVGVQDGGG